jgi:hypothetical protein
MEYRILYEIEDERKRQDQLWGGREHDDTHDEWDWLQYLTRMLEKTDRAILNQNMPVYRERLVKLAAIAIAAAESYDRLNISE